MCVLSVNFLHVTLFALSHVIFSVHVLCMYHTFKPIYIYIERERYRELFLDLSMYQCFDLGSHNNDNISHNNNSNSNNNNNNNTTTTNNNNNKGLQTALHRGPGQVLGEGDDTVY